MSLSLCHLTSWPLQRFNRKTSIIYQQKHMQTLCQSKFLGPFWQGATSILNYPFWSKPCIKTILHLIFQIAVKFTQIHVIHSHNVTLSEWSNLFCMSILGAYHKSPPAKQFRGLFCSTGWSRMILGFLLCLKTANNIAFQAIWNFGTWCFLGPDTRPVGLKENTISISKNQGTENNHSPQNKKAIIPTYLISPPSYP